MAHYLGELTDSSMKNLQGLVDSNSVIGQAVTTPDGTTILPVSKISFGYGSGGSDLPSSQKELFGGGSGGGVTITPVAFLVIRDGNVKVLNVQSYSNTADRVVDLVPDVVDKVTGLIGGSRKKSEATPDADSPSDGE